MKAQANLEPIRPVVRCPNCGFESFNDRQMRAHFVDLGACKARAKCRCWGAPV